MSATKPTSDFHLSIPDNITGAEDAVALAGFYARKISPAAQLRRLEEQAVFWLIHDLLSDPTSHVVEVSLGIPDEDEETLSVNLVFDVDGKRFDQEIYEDTNEEGGTLFRFLQDVKPSYGSDFIQKLGNPVTSENLWQIARKIFSSKEYANLETLAMERQTTHSIAPPSRKAPRV